MKFDNKDFLRGRLWLRVYQLSIFGMVPIYEDYNQENNLI